MQIIKDGFKSMQPKEWHPDKVTFPCWVSVKIDGVAAFNRYSNLLGRSLKKHQNKHVTSTFSLPEFHGFCGEMTSGSIPTGEDLCRITSGDLRREDSVTDTHWWLFDYCTEETKDLPYKQRLWLLQDKLAYLKSSGHPLADKLHVVETKVVHNMQELLDYEQVWLDEGYEGVIIRDPELPYKYGNCGKTFMGAWRIKRFIDAEAEIISIEEGNSNQNEAKTNERGRTERSTCQENLVPNGLLGNMQGIMLADVFDLQSGKLLLFKGQEITISPGEMDHDLRKFFFENPSEIVGKISKFKFFPKGIKDKPRFPVWISIRSKEDME